jgi:hypothetical protein
MEEAAMQSLTDYPDHWLERAENADRLAKEMDDPDAKRGMQDVASSYRRIAQRSAWREVTPCARDVAGLRSFARIAAFATNPQHPA